MSAVLLVSLALVPGAALLCGWFAEAQRRRSIGQQIRSEGPRAHHVKAGTPTMGGAVVLGLWGVSSSALFAVQGKWQGVPFVFLSAAAFASIGALDDLLGLRRRRSEGLSARQKLLLSGIAAVLLSIAFPDVLAVAHRVPFTTLHVTLPRIINLFLLGFVFLAMTNSVNLTDGLDGLAAGASLLAVVGLLVIVSTPPSAMLLLPLVGVLLGFLWTNAHPAQLFLGDVGAFGLGGLIAAGAMIHGLVLYLPLLAGLMALESLSVIVQVAWFRLRGRRVFKMAPLHHHFEASTRDTASAWIRSPEWPEEKVTVRFWILQSVFVGLAILASRV